MSSEREKIIRTILLTIIYKKIVYPALSLVCLAVLSGLFLIGLTDGRWVDKSPSLSAVEPSGDSHLMSREEMEDLHLYDPETIESLRLTESE